MNNSKLIARVSTAGRPRALNVTTPVIFIELVVHETDAAIDTFIGTSARTRKLKSSVKHNVCVGPVKKRGVRLLCAWKHFFTLGFCYFFAKKKVRTLEALELATKLVV